jgi:hypothetical protein
LVDDIASCGPTRRFGLAGRAKLGRAGDVGEVWVAFRPADDGEEVRPLLEVAAETLSAAVPRRQFRWHHGQKHFSGTYWSETEAGHVIYESRLELARLLFADFDRRVRRIAAQPFLLRAVVDGTLCRHIPDFLLDTASGPVVVDVKPQSRLQHPKVASTFGWTGQVMAARGWHYEVWSEPDPVELANVRFLAGYRRGRMFASEVLDGLRTSVRIGMTVSEAVESTPGFPAPTVRATLFRLLWRQEFTVDLSVRMGAASRLRVA